MLATELEACAKNSTGKKKVQLGHFYLTKKMVSLTLKAI